MSETPHVQRCIGWIREQIEGLATLRTANTRDQSFRNWRQNTVTVIQRIWPADHERVERFRRIVFTPPQSRIDARTTREWFGKGIGESRAYLNMLLETIEREGVPAPAETDRERDGAALEADVAFPLLDLSAKPPVEAPAATASPAMKTSDGLDVMSGYATPDDQGASRRDSSSPAPPALRVDWKAAAADEAPRAESPAATPPSLGESDVTEERAAADRPPVEIPLAPALAPPADSGAPQEDESPEAAAEDASEPAVAAPVAHATPAPEAAAPETPPPSRRESSSRPASRLRPGRGKAKKSGPKPKLKDLLGLSEFESRMQASDADAAEVSAVAAGAPAEEAAPPAEPAAVDGRAADLPDPPEPPADDRERRAAEAAAVRAESDDEDRERATLAFMRSSPVFGLVGKPVHRRSDAPEHTEPDAVAVAALAGDLARLGVPDGMKGSLAARLNDVAARLEAGDLDWPLLRGTVTDAMQYPLLARRLMPVLLPWLERAA